MKIINIPQIIINDQEKGLSIKSWAHITPRYANCGHGSHGRIDPIIPSIHSIIHTIQNNISMLLSIFVKYIVDVYRNMPKKQDGNR